MTPFELRQAGFKEDEVNNWLTVQHTKLKAAGFGDAEIEAKYGPMASTPPVPKPFDFQLLSTPVNVGQVWDTLKSYGRAWESVGFSAAEGFNRGMATFSAHLDAIGDWVNEKTGGKLSKGGLFKDAAKEYEANSEYWKKRANEVGTSFFTELLGEATGGALPGITEFMLNVPYAAALGAARASKDGHNEFGGAIVEAAKRGILGQLFHAMGPFNQYLRAPAMGTVFGVQAASEGGTKEDIAKAVGTGALYSLTSPGGRYGLNEIKDNAKSYLEKDIRKAYEIKDLLEPPVSPPPAEGVPGPVTPESSFPPVPGAPSPKQPFEAKTLISWVKSQGGIWDESLAGETNQFIGKESGVIGLLSKKSGKTFDELAEMAKDYGWIGPDATARDFIDLLSKDVSASKQGKERVKNFQQDIDKGILKEITKDEMAQGEWADTLTEEGWKVYGPREEMAVGDIEPGDRLLIKGEEYTHVGFDKKGNAIIKDGQTFRVDPFERLPVEAIKEGSGTGTPGMAPEADFRRTPTQKIMESDEPVSRSDIKEFLEEKLDIPIRTGRFRSAALGIFKIKSEVVRTKQFSDIEVIAHEIGHGLQKYLWPGSFKGKTATALFAPYADELAPIATKPKAGQPVEQEGFAEFIRLYITKEPEARAKAPRFYDYFDNLLQQKAPETRDIMLEARDMYNKFMEQPALQRTLSQISVGENAKKRTTFSDLYTLSVDDLHPLETIVREMTGDQKLGAGKDPYKLARLLKGWVGKAEAFLKNRPFEFKTYKDIQDAKPLKAILDPVRDRLDEFRAYIVSRRDLELKKRAIETGLLEEDSLEIVNRHDQEFGPVFEDLKKYQDLSLKYLLDSGLISKDIYAKIKALNDDYVPFYRVMDGQKNPGTGTGLEARDAIHKIKGSWRDIVDPLESIIKNTFLYINLAEKNAVGRALVDLAGQKDGMGKFVEKIPQPMQGTKVTPEEISRNMQDLAGKIGFEGEITPEMFESFSIFRPSAFTPKENVISVWKDGKAELFQVHPEIARVFQALDREQSGLLIRLLAKPASWLRAGATLTPEFLGRNPFRDQWSAFINSKYGFIPGFDLARGIFHMAKKDSLYWDFKKSGADHSMLVSMDRDYLQDNLGEMLQKYPLINTIKNPINALRMLSEIGEMGTRIGEFAKGLKAEGQDKAGMQEAGFAGREVSLDFARAGSTGRIAKQIVAFFNANVQGTDKMIRQFKEDPLGTSVRVAASITLPSVLLAIVNHDDPRYKDLPQWQKDLFWIIIPNRMNQATWDAMTPEQKSAETQWITGSIYRFPKTFEMGILFGTVPERITHYILDRDPKAFDHVFDTIARGFSPGFIPTLLGPIAENWANRSLFFDRPIVPRSKEDILPEYQYGNYTSDTAKELGKLIGKLPVIGDTGAASPANIENLIRGWTGGLGKYALDIADAGLRASGITKEDYEKPSKSLSDMPFFKGFVVRYPSANSNNIERFYESYQKIQKVQNTIKLLAQKEGDVEGAVRLYQESGGANLEGIATALSTMRKLTDMITRNPQMTGDEKREQLDIIYLQMSELAGYGVKMADNFEQMKTTIGGRQ